MMTLGLAINLVVFDLDGTLIDSLGDLADSMNVVLKSLDFSSHPRDSYRHFVGNGIEMLVRRALPSEVLQRSDIPHIVSAVRNEYSTRWLATTRPYPGIPELLHELQSRSVATAVLSNKPDHATRAIVGELFAQHDFAVVRGALDGVPLKPDPTAVHEIVSRLGLSPQASAFVGDTPVDMATGVSAGMLTVGVTWGFRDRHELAAAGADRIIDEALQLLDILDA
jgi:phosphoglycolate phosphatase